jgi:hypothetical protein
MKENPDEKGRFTEHGRGLGTVTEEMVRQRAAELALLSGRPPGQVFDSDLQQARRELTGAEGLVPEPTPAEELEEEERWEPVPKSIGHQAPTVEASDEQTFAEKLVEEGVEDAEQDQMVEGTRESQKRDRRT